MNCSSFSVEIVVTRKESDIMKKGLAVLLLIIFLPALSISFGQVMTGRISGKIMNRDGSPLDDALVFFFNAETGPPPAPDKYMLLPMEVVTTDDEGRFRSEFLEGKYYIGGVKHIMGMEGLPPHKGDLMFISTDDNNSPKAYSVRMGGNLDIEVIAEAVPYEGVTAGEGITAIEGTIQGVSGKPVENALVLAYMTAKGDRRQSFVSDWTDTEGRYFLRVHQGETYYLKVEDVYGSGLSISALDSADNDKAVSDGVTVETGEIKTGVHIRVLQVP